MTFRARSFAKDFGLFLFHEKERSKCISQVHLTSTAWRPSCSDHPVEINGAAAGSAGRIHLAKRTAIAGFASTTEKRRAAPWRSARYWMSGYPVVRPLFMKPFMRHGTLQAGVYYNNFRIKAKLKGLPPAIHRQQALLAA